VELDGLKPEYVVGLDLGGTQIRTCLARPEGSILRQARELTRASRGPSDVLKRIQRTISEVLDGVDVACQVSGIGIAAPGPLDPQDGVLLSPPNLPGWDRIPLRDIMQDAFGVPVFVNNDANLAALAEYRLGAGQGSSDMVYLTISTGLGAGIICAGKLLMGAHGFAGEPGHATIQPDGERCSCGNVGCLEGLSAGPAIARHARRLLEQGSASVLSGMASPGSDLTAEMVGKAAGAGDAVALQAVSVAAHYLAIGVLNLIHIFDPEIVVLGGGVTKLGPLLFEPVRAWVRDHAMTVLQGRTPIVPAALGEEVGLLGGVVYVVEQLGDPGSQ
jgi:glucokinase